MNKTLLTFLAFLTFMTAFSAKADVYEGQCGDNLTWRLDTETETLTINGSGDMYDYGSNTSPWAAHSESLAHVIIGDSVTSIGNKAFTSHGFIKSVHIGNSVVTIGENAFYGCGRLHNVFISDSVKEINSGAFSYCRSLREITIPKSVEVIKSNVFCECEKLESIVVDPENTKYDSRDNCNGIVVTASNKLFITCKNTVVANTISHIGYKAFEDGAIESVDMPNSVREIDDLAFVYCRKLTHLTLGDSLESIGSAAFSGCELVEELYIPGSVRLIGGSAFSSCCGLKSIAIAPENEFYDSREDCNAIILTKTNELLWGCNNTVFPKTITSIGENAFIHCSGIENVVIPDQVKNIKMSAFQDCGGLVSVVLPASLETVGYWAFNGCDKLSSIYILATTPPECAGDVFGSNSVFTIFDKATLYVPYGCRQAYKEAKIWKDFWNIVELPEGYGICENQKASVSVFPNPTTDFINIKCENMTSIDIITTDGKIADIVEAHDDDVQIDMRKMPRGTYFVRIKTREGIVTNKIIKE